MPIFARRRLQAMLDELAPLLTLEKGKDIIARLNHPKKVDQALPAEMELALLWAIQSLGDLEIEPEWWGDTNRPDAITSALVPGRSAAIEIFATNDNAISGEVEMDSIALQVCDAANRVEKGVGKFLYFTFRVESGYASGQYFRRRLAPKDFKLTALMGKNVMNWVSSGRSLDVPLLLQETGLDVVIVRKTHPHSRFHNISSSMPPETHSLEDNPLFKLLRRKRRQLKAGSLGMLRIMFLADVGSTLLREIGKSGEHDHSNRRVSGSQIIAHFMAKYAEDVDAVVAFSPIKEHRNLSLGILHAHKPRYWKATYFGSPELSASPEALARIVEVLPAPRYEGHQARSLFRQDGFSSDRRGQYLELGFRVSKAMDERSAKFPARLLLDLLAGRITQPKFRHYVGDHGSENIFALWLDGGMTISRAEMAPRDVDEDDDHIVLYFSDDPAARPLKLNQS